MKFIKLNSFKEESITFIEKLNVITKEKMPPQPDLKYFLNRSVKLT